jgi:uncharacterized protein YkwD
LTHSIHTQSFARTVAFLTTLIIGLSAPLALANSSIPTAPPRVGATPTVPATMDLSLIRVTAAQSTYSQRPAPQAAQPASQSGDPYGFTAWLNGVRARSGLAPVGHDANLSSWAAVNNGQQNARGLGHHVMGYARRQNAGMGAAATVWSMWMASPAHQAALLDPTITRIGIAASGSYWTFNAY